MKFSKLLLSCLMVGGISASGSAWAVHEHNEAVNSCSDANEQARKALADNPRIQDDLKYNPDYQLKMDPDTPEYTTLPNKRVMCAFRYEVRRDVVGGASIPYSSKKFFVYKMDSVVERGPSCDKDSTTKNPVDIATGDKFFVFPISSKAGVNLKLTYLSSDGLWRDNLKTSFSDIYSQALQETHRDNIEVKIEETSSIKVKGSQYLFNKSGKLLSGPLGSYQYNGATITIGQIKLERDMETGQLLRATAPGGVDISLTYDSQKRVTTLNNSGQVTHYQYQDERHPRAITHVLSSTGEVFKEITYYEDGRVQSSSLADKDEIITFEYPTNGRVITTNEWGKKTKYDFIYDINGKLRIKHVSGYASSHCLAANKNYEYDFDTGLMTSQTDWNGLKTTFEYNDKRLLTKKTVGAGTQKAKITTYTWDSAYRLVMEQSEQQSIVYKWNGKNLVEKKVYSKQGSAQYSALKLDTMVDALSPSRHYVMSDIDNNLSIPNRAGGSPSTIVLNEQAQQPLIIDSPNQQVASKYLNLNSQAYIEMGELPIEQIKDGFTWILWGKFENSKEWQNIFNASNPPKNGISQDNIALYEYYRSGSLGYDSRKQKDIQFLMKRSLSFQGRTLLAVTYHNGTYTLHGDSLTSTRKGAAKIAPIDRKYFSVGRGMGIKMWEQSGDFKVGRIATFDRALTEEEIQALYQASQQ